jgi:hypothetical protein
MEYFPLDKEEEGNILSRGEKIRICLTNEIIIFYIKSCGNSDFFKIIKF